MPNRRRRAARRADNTASRGAGGARPRGVGCFDRRGGRRGPEAEELDGVCLGRAPSAVWN